MPFVDILDGGPAPKRGDIVQTNLGDRRERTWMILRVRRMARAKSRFARFDVWMARWWELEPEMRAQLYASAERNGGQRVIYFARYRQPKKRKVL